MKISIAQRLRPFSHRPGTSCLVPGTAWQVTAFPTLLQFYNLQTGEEREEVLSGGKSFTLTQDLERGEVRVGRHVIKLGKLPASIERLSLGSHKALDWDLCRRRLDLADILPVWFRLGQMVPSDGTLNFPALDKLEAAPFLEKVFCAYFHGILVPRLFDEDHQGLFPAGKPIATAPLALLVEGARWIRTLFFQDNFKFLPNLPPQFHAGRLLHVQTKEGDSIDMEWSKKLLRRVVIRPGKSREVHIQLQKSLASFRVRRSAKDRGQRQLAEAQLSLEKGKVLFLDQFQK